MLVLILVGALGYQSEDVVRQIDFLRLSYKANKEAFAFGSFRFEYTRATSSSLAEAESEVFKKAFTENGFYVFDGENARYELVTSPEVLAAATERIDELHTNSFITAFRSLTDGNFTLRDNLQPYKGNTVLLHGVIVFPGTSIFYQHDNFEFPLWLGDKGGGTCDLFQDLSAVKDGKIVLTELDMNSRLGDTKVCKFSYTWKDGSRTFWIDVDRGSVPLRILEHYNPNNVDITYVFSDLEHVANAGWLPRRRLHVLGQGAIVDRFVVNEIDTRTRPPKSIFQLDFPEPITCYDDAKKLVYPKRATWSLLNLPNPKSAGVRPVIPFIPPSELPVEVLASPVWTIILSVLVVLFLIVGSALLTRRMSRARGV